MTASSATVPWADEPESAQVRHLRSEISATVAEAARQGKRAERWAVWWNGTFLVLGLPSAILAALSGATGLASTTARVPAAVLALVSAGLAAASGFLRSDAKALEARRRSSAWRAFEADARQVAANEGYQSALEIARAWSFLQTRRKFILAGDYEAVLGVVEGKQLKFTSNLVSGIAVPGEE